MIAYILRRLLAMIPVLIGVLAITLTLFFVVAEDPVLQYVGQNPSEEQLRAKRREFSLDVPAFFSPSWLAGEDLLESKRRIELQRVFDELAARLTRFRTAAMEYPEGEARDAALAEFETLNRAIDDFRADWRRDVELEGKAETINESLRELLADGAPQVDFNGITLTPAEQEEVASRSIWDAQFFRVLRFDFANSMQHERPIWDLIIDKAPRSLAVTIPMFLIGLAIELTLALFCASRRGKLTDTGITILAVFAMSIPFLSYVIFGQWLAAETGIVPVSGWAPGFEGIRYLVFPVTVGVIAGMGSAIRFYRAVLLEEMDRDYVRTARAKGVRGFDVLYVHVLRNAGIPIVTRLSVIIPFLITGSLLIETTFEIPGLGDMLLSAIQARDFWVVMPLTYLLAVVYSVTVLLTDIVYALIDPRVRVGEA